MKIKCNICDNSCPLEAEFFFSIINIKNINDDYTIYASCSFHQKDIASGSIYHYKKPISKEKYIKLLVIK